jgi:hypothetical protein
VVWIDHHATSIEKFDKEPSFTGFRMVGVAACRLCWAWFNRTNDTVPTLAQFKAREVKEPLLVTLVGEHDVFDHHDKRALWLSNCLKALPRDEWAGLFDTYIDTYDGFSRLLSDGELITRYVQVADALAFKQAMPCKFFGYSALAINALGNSGLFEARTAKVDIGIRWTYGPNGVLVTLFALDNQDVNVGEIAKAMGGGGHKGAAGFKTTLEIIDSILTNKFTPPQAQFCV